MEGNQKKYHRIYYLENREVLAERARQCTSARRRRRSKGSWWRQASTSLNSSDTILFERSICLSEAPLDVGTPAVSPSLKRQYIRFGFSALLSLKCTDYRLTDYLWNLYSIERHLFSQWEMGGNLKGGREDYCGIQSTFLQLSVLGTKTRNCAQKSTFSQFSALSHFPVAC